MEILLHLNSLSTGQNFYGKDSSTIYFISGKKVVLQPGCTINEGTYFETLINPNISNCNSLNVRRKK